MSANFQPNVYPYKETGSFRFWCQKVLPLVYDDSLSYYELLCKVVNYLNDVIANVDGLHDDVLSTNQAFYELQSYVNNYFADLDLTSEINAKLDELVLDGTMESLIEPIIEGYEETFAEQIAEQNNAISVLEGRVDVITNLPEGSTSGDAELADIRVGENGITYNDAGNAVRKQFAEVWNKLSVGSNNMFYLTFGEESVNGITIKQDVDGSVVVNGTTTAGTRICICGSQNVTTDFLSAGTYSAKQTPVSGTISNANGISLRFDVSGTSAGTLWTNNGTPSASITLVEASAICLYINNATTFSNYRIRFQIETGSSVGEYKPNVSAYDYDARFVIANGVKCVTPEMFGAKGDGTTDDIDAINGAIDYLAEIGGGSVYFNAKTYLIGDSIVIKKNVNLLGCGKQSVIKVKARANCDAIISYGFGDYTGGQQYDTVKSDTDLPQNFRIENLTIDCNAVFVVSSTIGNRTVYECDTNYNHGGYGIKLFAKRYVIKNVQIQNVPRVGFYTEYAQSGYSDEELNDIGYMYQTSSIDGLYIINCGQEGIINRGGADNLWNNVWVRSALMLNSTSLVDIGTYPKSAIVHQYSSVYHYEPSTVYGFIHVWGTQNGYGLCSLGQTFLKGSQIVIESCLGGLYLNNYDYADINTLDIHNLFYGDSGYYLYTTTGDGYINITNLAVRVSSDVSGKKIARIGFSNSNINMFVRGNNRITDALELVGNHNTVKCNVNNLNGSPIEISGNRNIVELSAYNCGEYSDTGSDNIVVASVSNA